MQSKWKNWSIVLALTGGIGTGKSTVLQMFRKKGASTLDADEIVRRAYQDKAVLRKIRKLFGSGTVSSFGQLHKKKIAQVVFSSSLKRKKLESILHPIVRSTMSKYLKKHRGNVAVCDIPLLYEGGLAPLYDKVIVVRSALATQLIRLKKRGISPAEAKRRMKAQWPLSKKIKKADFVINNNESLMKTKHQVEKIYESFRRMK